MNKAVVLHHGAESSLYFFVLPALRADGYEAVLWDLSSTPKGGAFDDVEMVVVVRYWPCSLRWRLMLRQARSAGARCVYFMDDDLFSYVGFGALPRRYANKLIALAWRQRRQILSWCNLLWVSSKELADRYANYYPRLLPLQPLIEVRDKCATVLIGYHGTGCHRSELVWLFPLVAQLQQIYSNTLIELYGDESIFKLYAPLPRVRVHRPLAWEQFLQITALQRLDILLCPLLKHPFNTARAPVKFWDAARLEAAGLYSNREPYGSFVRDGLDGLLLVDNYQSWLAAIGNLIANPSYRVSLVEAAQRRTQLEGGFANV